MIEYLRRVKIVCLGDPGCRVALALLALVGVAGLVSTDTWHRERSVPMAEADWVLRYTYAPRVVKWTARHPNPDECPYGGCSADTHTRYTIELVQRFDGDGNPILQEWPEGMDPGERIEVDTVSIPSALSDRLWEAFKHTSPAGNAPPGDSEGD